jgi:hypothetical protein
MLKEMSIANMGLLTETLLELSLNQDLGLLKETEISMRRGSGTSEKVS